MDLTVFGVIRLLRIRANVLVVVSVSAKNFHNLNEFALQVWNESNPKVIIVPSGDLLVLTVLFGQPLPLV
jgi:hypothetical protein